MSVLLVGLFADTSLLLASVGLYGTLACSVGRRSREIGIRVALGARREAVSRLVWREGMILVGIGLFIGLVISFALSRLLTMFLYGVGPNDSLTFDAVCLLLSLTGLLACYFPARRAARINPIAVLRE